MRWILAFLILGAILLLGYSLIKPKIFEISSQPTQVSEPEIAENKKVTIILVGDIMLNRKVKYVVEKYGNGDFRFPFLKIADYLKEADIVFGNLEGPVSDKGEKVGSIYSFRNDPKSIEGLISANFNVISLANNHSLDFGKEALEDTFLRLKKAGIDYVGAGFNEREAYSPLIKEINDTKIAFLAYTNLGPKIWQASENNSGIAWISENDFERIKEDIRSAKEKSDILIVSLHAGEEYQMEPTQFQTEFAKMAIDSGADLVVGHHPHSIQPIEKYKEGCIAYSLGNFIFDQSFSEETMKGKMLKVLIENKKIKEIIPINIRINENFQPEIEKFSLSSEKLEQGDTLLIKVSGGQPNNAFFNEKKIDFLKIGSNWIGILGIDAKEKPGEYDLVINFKNSKIKKKIKVVERKFPVTELLVTKELEEKGFSPSKIAENVQKENSILKEILGIYTEKAYFDKAFIFPLEKIEIIGDYGNIRKSGKIGFQHLGVDLEANVGTPVFAVNDGIARFSGELTNYGKTLIIDHGLGIFSLYLHLQEFKVKEGDFVKRGKIIALSGNTGYSIEPHLHFSIKVNGASVDPLRFIETTRYDLVTF